MAKGTRKKAAKEQAVRKGADGPSVARIEKALATALRREAKAASRLEAAQAETATLRTLLAGLVRPAGEAPAPAPKPAPAAKPRSAAKLPAVRVTPAKAPAAKPAAAATPARPRRARPAPAPGAASDR